MEQQAEDTPKNENYDIQTDDSITAVIQVIKMRFPPAINFAESTLQLTTSEIFNLLQEHCPGGYTGADIYKQLFINGYKFDTLTTNEINFVWLLKQPK